MAWYAPSPLRGADQALHHPEGARPAAPPGAPCQVATGAAPNNCLPARRFAKHCPSQKRRQDAKEQQAANLEMFNGLRAELVGCTPPAAAQSSCRAGS